MVATCIGEEGLDIGEVDLIVCFDPQFAALAKTRTEPNNYVQHLDPNTRALFICSNSNTGEAFYNMGDSFTQRCWRKVLLPQ